MQSGTKRKIQTLTLVFFTCIGVSAGNCGGSKEGELKIRFQKYMAAWEKLDIHEVAKFMAPLASGKRDFEKEYSDVVKREGVMPKIGSYTIQNISVEGNKGRVIADWVAVDPSGKILATIRQGCDAVYIGKSWYFSSCKPSGTATR